MPRFYEAGGVYIFYNFLCYNNRMSDSFRTDSVFWGYAKWHYGKGVREVVSVGGNFLLFISHFFSFGLLTRTLFAPWKRMGESYGEGFDLGRFAETFIVNSLMRAVGFVTRVIVLAIGFLLYVCVFVLCLALFLIWIFAPILLMASLILTVTFFVI